MATVHTSVEGARGCGYRKGGGLYMVSGKLSEPCELLPIPLHVCPTCGEGVKQSRGFTWILPDPLLGPRDHGSSLHNQICPLGGPMLREKWSEGERAGLIWIGEAYYKTPREFMDEAARMGVSRRIPAVPRGFKVGEHWVALAHPKAIRQTCHCPRHEFGAELPDPACEACRGTGYTESPGVITFFMPTAVEYVVKGDESEEELDALEERGLRLVKVVRAGEDRTLDEPEEVGVT